MGKPELGNGGSTNASRLIGFSVLLLEARDRIGGRTFTAEVDGHLYEMGGTWVHWNQPHTYREMSRYGLTELLLSHDKSVGVNYYTALLNGNRQIIDHEKAVLASPPLQVMKYGIVLMKLQACHD